MKAERRSLAIHGWTAGVFAGTLLCLIPTAAQADGPGVKRVVTLSGHARRARTSGSMGTGTIESVAFLGDGRALVTGGNDDRVMLWRTRDGKRRWRSRRLGKDVEQVMGCSGRRFAARIYGGKTFIFQRRGRRARRKKVIRNNFGWTAGLSRDCRLLVRDDFDGRLNIFDTRRGRRLRSLPYKLPHGMDMRGVGQGPYHALVPFGGQGFRLLSLGRGRRGVRRKARLLDLPLVVPRAGRLAMVRFVGRTSLLLEYQQGAEDRTLRLVLLNPAPGGGLRAVMSGGDTVRITAKSNWFAGVPTTAEVSADGRHLLYYRDGLGVNLVDLQTGKTLTLFNRPRTMAGTYTFAFHPTDATLMVLAMDPKPHRAAIYRITADQQGTKK